MPFGNDELYERRIKEKDAKIKELEDRNKLLSRDNINLRKFVVDSRNKLSDFITSDLEGK